MLAIDTCDSRGSIAILREDAVARFAAHETAEDYSVWLLPAVNNALLDAGISMGEVEAFAVASGPGSFTGVRAGLTTVKAWAEVYGKPIAAVSRLEAIATEAAGGTEFIAACADARRSQVFGAIYHRAGDGLALIGDEMVISPGRFIELVAGLAGGDRVSWASTDPAILIGAEEWCAREKLDETLDPVSPFMAEAIGRMGIGHLRAGRIVDALALDANYVRRTDAEMYWQDGEKKTGT